MQKLRPWQSLIISWEESVYAWLTKRMDSRITYEQFKALYSAVLEQQFDYWDGGPNHPEPAHVCAWTWLMMVTNDIETGVDEVVMTRCHESFVSAISTHAECDRIQSEINRAESSIPDPFDWDEDDAKYRAWELVDSDETGLPDCYSNDNDALSALCAFRDYDRIRKLLNGIGKELDVRFGGRKIGDAPRNYPSRPVATNGAKSAPSRVDQCLRELRTELYLAPEYTGTIPYDISQLRQTSTDVSKHRNRSRSRVMGRLLKSDKRLRANKEAAWDRTLKTQTHRTELVAANRAARERAAQLWKVYRHVKKTRQGALSMRFTDMMRYPQKYGLPPIQHIRKRDGYKIAWDPLFG